MKLPKFDDVEFTPLAWKEWFLDRDLRSKKMIFEYLDECNEENYFEDCLGLKNYVKNTRIRRLLNGYAILDLMDWTGTIRLLRYKMWRLFEDTVAEILREFFREREECSVVYVDKWKGFRGLDYIIVNSKSMLGWEIGVQCKRYIGSRIPYSRIHEFSRYTRGTSAAQLHDKGIDLKNKYSEKRKFALITFNAFRRNKRQEHRFNNLSDAWDLVMVLDENQTGELPYTYRLRCDGLKRVVRWR